MSEAAAPEGGVTAKWYTRARKFPELVGKTPDGKRLPGGPYTLTQVIGGFAFGYLLYKTTGIWAHAGSIWNIAIWFGATYGFVWILGRIPPGARNPISLIAGVVRSVTSPSVGRINGRRVTVKRPYRIRHRVLVATPAGALAPARPIGREVPPATENTAVGTPRHRPNRNNPAPTLATDGIPDGADLAAPDGADLATPDGAAPAAPAAFTGVQRILAGAAMQAGAPDHEHHHREGPSR